MTGLLAMPLRAPKPWLAVTFATACALVAAVRLAPLRPAITEASNALRQAELDAEAKRYRPTVAGTIGDMGSDAAAILRGLPAVAKVDVVIIGPGKPTCRIIHFRDWHYSRESVAMGFDADAALLAVELVQAELAAALDCLARHHGLTTVMKEGLTAADMPYLPGKVAELRGPATSTKERRVELAHVGAPIKLLVEGKLERVLPLDDAGLLDASNPIKDGKVQFDPAIVARRERAMIRNALASGRVAVIVCGGAHDLADAIRQAADDGCEYVQVTVKGYATVAGEPPR